ncbi:hypothetical protein GX411_07895 [Candidatus Fermentibacteria bacterium]|nr:hypothetical protein [Candidatus Fermentibacteria bacterium]
MLFEALLLLSCLSGGPCWAPPGPADMTCAAGGDSLFLLLTTGTDAGLAAWSAGTGMIPISLRPGAGRNAFVLDGTVVFKECLPDRQRICTWSEDETVEIASAPALCGPFPAGPAGFMYSDELGIHLHSESGTEVIVACPEAAMAPSAAFWKGSVWFVDGGGRLRESHPGGAPCGPLFEGVATVAILGGSLVVRSLDGRFLLLDFPVIAFDGDWIEGSWPVLSEGLGLCCCRSEGSASALVGAESNAVLVAGALRPFHWQGHGLVWTESSTGRLRGTPLPPEGLRFPGCPGTAERGVPFDPVVEIDVPWMHQRWDTPDWFDGSWSCGPSSCTMAQQYYGRLTPDSIWCSSPSPGHWSSMGDYIPTEFTFLGFTYDIPGLSPGGVWVPGAHGFICRDAGGAYWSYMTLYLEQMGLESDWAGTAWSTLTSELDNLWPVVCSSTIYYSGGTYGHIILFTGFCEDHTVVVNDPYGDANQTGWGQSWRYPNGKACLYDWPGYNNGHLEIGAVNQLFSARHDVPAPPDTLVDDLCTGFEKRGGCQYWHEEQGGFGGTFWWTWSTAAPPDTCFVKWRPSLPGPGWYEVSVFVPEDHAGATGIYRLSTPSGTVEIPLDQGAWSSEWAPLGTFWLVPGDSLYLGDFTGTGAQQLAFDAALFSPRPESSPGGGAGGSLRAVIGCPAFGSIPVTLDCAPLPVPAEIDVFDIAGRLAASGEIPPGGTTVSIGAGLPPGCYAIRISLPGAALVDDTVLLP